MLELEAEVQRVSLAATFARWEQRRALGWMVEGLQTLLRTLKSPRMRWILFATAMRALKRRA